MGITYGDTLTLASQINQLYSREGENEVIDSKLSSTYTVQAQTTRFSKNL